MTDTLRLARNLELPIAAVTTTEAIVGIRGSGKTNTAVVEAEELLAHGQQIVVVDATDVWWGLKSSKDGTRAGYPVVILGGRRADLPLAAGDGAVIADFIVDERASVVLSLRHFESRGDERRFVTDLARRLYHRKGQEGQEWPLKLFIDEASRYVPQRVMGEDAKMVGAIQQIVRQGRASGFGVTLIDQRPATLNKDVLTQLELLVCHRITSPQDRQALLAWVEQHDTEGHGPEFLESLASLDQGDAWFWSPGWLDLFKRVHVRERRTFDSSRTPKPGETVITPTRVAEVDLEQLRTKLGATIGRARAEDPRELQKEIQRLERELRQATSGNGHVDRETVQRAIDEAVARTRSSLIADWRRLGAGVAKGLRRSVDELATIADRIATGTVPALTEAIDSLEPKSESPAPSSSPPPAVGAAVPGGHRGGPTTRPALLDAPTPRRASSHRSTVGGTGQRILNALAFFEQFGVPTPADSQVAALVGVTSTSGSWSARVSELRTAGLIRDVAKGVHALTDDGRQRAETTGLPRTLEELHEFWIRKVGGTAGRMLRVLIDTYPDAIDKAALAGMVGIAHTSGSFSARLSEIRTPGLLDDVSKTEVRASQLLFPPGLR